MKYCLAVNKNAWQMSVLSWWGHWRISEGWCQGSDFTTQGQTNAVLLPTTHTFVEGKKHKKPSDVSVVGFYCSMNVQNQTGPVLRSEDYTLFIQTILSLVDLTYVSTHSCSFHLGVHSNWLWKLLAFSVFTMSHSNYMDINSLLM